MPNQETPVGVWIGNHELVLIREGEPNPLKQTYFPAYTGIYREGKGILIPYNVLWTFGRRTEEGVAREDVSFADASIMREAILKAGEEKRYEPMPVEAFVNCFAQVVDPEQSVEQRKQGRTGESTVDKFNIVACGGFPNLDAMKMQHPGQEFDHPYYVKDMRRARIIPKRRHLVWGYIESAEEQNINLDNYRWQDMVKGKDGKGPWQWALYEVFPSGKARDILRVDEVPADLIKDAVLIYAGKGVNPYNPEMFGAMIVGGRRQFTGIGGKVVDRDPILRELPGAEKVLEELDYAIKDRPLNSRGIEIVITGWTSQGRVVKLDKLFEVAYF